MDTKEYLKKYTDEELAKMLAEEIREAINEYNGDSNGKLVSFDREKGEITVKFDFHVVPEDEYVGLGCY